jgi:hypothetical protein
MLQRFGYVGMLECAFTVNETRMLPCTYRSLLHVCMVDGLNDYFFIIITDKCVFIFYN